MSCEKYRVQIADQWDTEESAELCRHLVQCPACAAYRRDLGLIRAGLHLLKYEAVPEPSVGFAERLVRQLSQAPSVTEFLERVGRRFVYAALVLTSLVLLALAMPETGPVRGLTLSDIQISTQEASLAYTDPIGEMGMQETPDAPTAEAPASHGSNEVK